MDPLIILSIGVVALVTLIIVFRVNAFIALISVAMLVSLLAPGEAAQKISRVAEAFGRVMGSIGIVIALAAVIGKCLMDSGAADRIVRSMLKLFGVKRASAALMGSGFVLSIPVFFDTVFYLLVPLARSLAGKTGRSYLLYLTAICGGAALTHTLVPPTPGPLFIASAFSIDLGIMMSVGLAVALPSAFLSLFLCRYMDRIYDIPMRPYRGQEELRPVADDELPSLGLSMLPVILPVILITGNTLSVALGASEDVLAVTGVLGNPNLALLISAVLALVLLKSRRRLTLVQMSEVVENALMSAGVIILITAAGGAFGAMLREAGLQQSVASWIDAGSHGLGLFILSTAFGIASLLKFAQGSSTVSMITTASIFSALGLSGETLGFNLVYLATAIGSGALVGSWMNDSGFWIYSRMGGMTELESLKTWSVLLAALGILSMSFTLLYAMLLPLP